VHDSGNAKPFYLLCQLCTMPMRITITAWPTAAQSASCSCGEVHVLCMQGHRDQPVLWQ
jgi:hypothetical protein